MQELFSQHDKAADNTVLVCVTLGVDTVPSTIVIKEDNIAVRFGNHVKKLKAWSNAF